MNKTPDGTTHIDKYKTGHVDYFKVEGDIVYLWSDPDWIDYTNMLDHTNGELQDILSKPI